MPVAIIVAIRTKQNDDGLTFTSNHVFVIIFAHIAEEILGLLLTPFWALRYTINKDWEFYRALDTILYLIEVLLILGGLYLLFNR